MSQDTEREAMDAVTTILREADGTAQHWRRHAESIYQLEVGFALNIRTREIESLHLPADVEANALKRLREVLGISER